MLSAQCSVSIATKFTRTMDQLFISRCNCDFSVRPYDLKHCVTCCARPWDNFHEVSPSTTYQCLNYSVFMLIHYVTLWPWPMTLKVRGTSSVTWSKSVQNLSEIKHSPAELLIILQIFASAAAEPIVLIIKRKKECSSVKLKAFDILCRAA